MIPFSIHGLDWNMNEDTKHTVVVVAVLLWKLQVIDLDLTPLSILNTNDSDSERLGDRPLY